MARRLIALIGIALAAPCAARMATAQVPEPPRTTPTTQGTPLASPGAVIEPTPDRPVIDPAEREYPPPPPRPAPDDGNGPAPGALPSPAATPAAPGDISPADPNDTPTRREPPTFDPEVYPAQTAPAGAGAAPAAAAGEIDRYPLGPQVVGVSVEVQAPATANVNVPSTFKILIKNTGSADARAVVVRDALPPGLSFGSSKPEDDAKTPAGTPGASLAWTLDTLAAGAERTISVTVTPTEERSIEHAATVVVQGGSRGRTQVRRPQLKVEQVADSSQETRGRQVQFTIKVTNTGTGPARSVTVKAKLSKGLKHSEGQELFVSLKAVKGENGTIAPGETVPLDLVVDTAEGGDQTCEVVAASPDVPDTPAAHNTLTIKVVEPGLKLDVAGPSKRFPDTVARYTLRVTNPGSAPSKKVKVAAYIPPGSRIDDKGGAIYYAEKKVLYWTVPELAPGEQRDFSFQMLMGGPQVFRVDGVAAASDCPTQYKSLGTALVDCKITERRQAIEVNEETIYEINVTNTGTVEAKNLQIAAELSEGLTWEQTGGTEQDAQDAVGDKRHVKFPLIPTLAPGEKLPLEIRVKAHKPGLATCQVSLTHDELEGGKIQHTQHTRVMSLDDVK